MFPLSDFAGCQIKNARDGSVTALGELWKEKPCALFFLRRLGCAICRSYIQMIEKFRQEYERTGLKMVCLSFESLGEGSDSDRSFEKYGFWKGELFTIDKSVCEALFGRKKLMDNFFGLMDIDKEAYARSKDVPGNLKGDGFQLGGQFVVAKGGKVILDHRQKFYGDDVRLPDLFKAIDSCLS